MQKATGASVKYKNVTASGSKYPNFEITSHSFAEYKSILSDRMGKRWNIQVKEPRGAIYLIETNNTKYVARSFANNGKYDYTIGYHRNGTIIGKFRFSK